MKYRYTLGMIGSGNMAKAIADGILNQQVLSAEQICMSASTEKAPYRGIRITADNAEILQSCEYVILAVKPQVYRAIADTSTHVQSKCIISIMAGISLDTLRAKFGPNVIRVMPNTPGSVGKGMSVLARTDLPQEMTAFAETVFRQIGEVAWLDENMFDCMTAVSGSGPAYIYYFIRSMIDAAVSMGMDSDTARQLTLQTFDGAVAMVRANADTPIDTLIARVCSKGGTTIEAIRTFEANGLDKTIALGMQKCKTRSEELSKA